MFLAEEVGTSPTVDLRTAWRVNKSDDANQKFYNSTRNAN